MSTKHFLFILLTFFYILPTKSQAVSKDFVSERIYLQTDKQIYITGELMWMKLISASPEGIPLSFSKVAYVELWDENASHMQAKIDLRYGVGKGWLITPIQLPTGYYRLIAYTKNMRNESSNVFFQKNIAVVNPLELDKTSSEASAINAVSGNGQGNISLSTDKTLYSQREKVKINIEGLPEDTYTLSVSVAGIDPVDTKEETTGILQWKNQLASIQPQAFSGKFFPEYEGHIIEGKMINTTTDRQEFNARVKPFVGFVGPDLAFFSGMSDEEGNIKFLTNHTAGIKEIVTAPLYISSNIESGYRIDIDYPFVDKFQTGRLPSLDKSRLDNNYFMQRNIALQVLHSFTNDSVNQLISPRSYFNWKPDHTYIMDEYRRFATMQEVITEFVVFTRFRRINDKRFLSIYDINTNTFSSGLTFVFLDGVPVFDHDIIYNYDPTLLKRIDVYKDNFVFGSQMVNGIVFFTTYQGDYSGLKLDNSTQFFDYEGTKAERMFYSPVYNDDEDRKSRLPDFRHTLLWNPEIQTNGNTPVSIPLYTSDIAGKFQVTVEGITTTGKPVYAVSTFDVR